MKIPAVASLFVVIAVGVLSAQLRPDSSETPRPRRRIPVELSEMMPHSPLVSCGAGAAPTVTSRRVRIASWNIQAAQSARPDAIAAELKAMEADIIALQEVDVGTKRTEFADIPTILRTALGFHYVFAASILWDQGHYGLAVLSTHPLARVERHRLDDGIGEPRIILSVTVCAHNRRLRILTHHADRRPAARATGFARFNEIVRPLLGEGIVIAGDLNEYPDAPGIRSLIDAGLVDLGAANPANTTSNGRIDYLLVDRLLAPRASPARVWQTDKSDHHAVLADLDW